MNKKLIGATIILSLIGVFLGFNVKGAAVFRMDVFYTSLLLFVLALVYTILDQKTDLMSKGFFIGSFWAMLVFLALHDFFIVMTLFVKGNWVFLFQFVITVLGVIPGILLGGLIGFFVVRKK